MDIEKQTRIISWAYLGVAMGIGLFWIGFYSGLIFPIEILEPLIKNFDGYYAWETSFTIPDGIMALGLVIGAARLINNCKDRVGKLVFVSAVGASIFLGVLDFVYAIGNGMYELGHIYSYLLMSIGIGLPILGVYTMTVFIRIEGELMRRSSRNALR